MPVKRFNIETGLVPGGRQAAIIQIEAEATFTVAELRGEGAYVAATVIVDLLNRFATIPTRPCRW